MVSRTQLEDRIREHDEHVRTLRYFSREAETIGEARPYFENLNDEDNEKIHEAISLLKEVADRHDEKADEINEKYGLM